MKYQWEAADTAAGRIITSPKNDRFLLGYTVSPACRCLISLADGRVAVGFTDTPESTADERLANFLNLGRFAPIEHDPALREAAAVVSGVKR